MYIETGTCLCVLMYMMYMLYAHIYRLSLGREMYVFQMRGGMLQNNRVCIPVSLPMYIYGFRGQYLYLLTCMYVLDVYSMGCWGEYCQMQTIVAYQS